MKQFRGIFLAILSSSTFGMIPFFALPVIQEGVGIDSILFYRFAVSAVIVGLYLLFVKSDFRITAKELVTLFFSWSFLCPYFFMPYGVLFVYSQQCCDHCAFFISGIGDDYYDIIFQK